MLEVKNLSLAYGLHRALDGVALNVARGEIVTILGANGAGKTSLLKAIAGVVRTLPGKQVRLGGRDISALAAHEIVESGLALVPEGRGIFGDLSVKENLLLGANPKRARDGEAARREQVLELFPRLRERAAQIARTMSGGEQQMLAIGRALMGRPTLLLLDEPSMGLAPRLVAALLEVVESLRSRGVTMLLVEQNAQAALSIADRGYVLETGRTTLEGPGRELLGAEAVRAAYLGIRRESA
jgi:branched-chain amino acid transport system ATP-binding protein